MARDQMSYERDEPPAAPRQSVDVDQHAGLIELLSQVRQELLSVADGWRRPVTPQPTHDKKGDYQRLRIGIS